MVDLERESDDFGEIVPQEAIDLPSANVQRLTETYVPPRKREGEGGADGQE